MNLAHLSVPEQLALFILHSCKCFPIRGRCIQQTNFKTSVTVFIITSCLRERKSSFHVSFLHRIQTSAKLLDWGPVEAVMCECHMKSVCWHQSKCGSTHFYSSPGQDWVSSSERHFSAYPALWVTISKELQKSSVQRAFFTHAILSRIILACKLLSLSLSLSGHWHI